MGKVLVLYSYNKYYTAIKGNKLLIYAISWVDLKKIMWTERR